jgi:transcriptional regulator with XRE-family HTH domain
MPRQAVSSEIAKNFGACLRRLRGSRTQKEFAAHLQLSSRQALNRYEHGSVPESKILYQIAKRLSVPVDDLLSNRASSFQPRSGERGGGELAQTTNFDLKLLSPEALLAALIEGISGLSSESTADNVARAGNVQLLARALWERLRSSLMEHDKPSGRADAAAAPASAKRSRSRAP